MACLADVVETESVFNRTLLGAVLTADLEFMRVVAGSAEHLARLRIEWQLDATGFPGFAHVLQNIVRRCDQMHPLVEVLRRAEGHTPWMRPNHVAASTGIVQVMGHVELNDKIARLVVRRNTRVTQRAGWGGWRTGHAGVRVQLRVFGRIVALGAVVAGNSRGSITKKPTVVETVLQRRVLALVNHIVARRTDNLSFLKRTA